jgi:phage terminase small subunit
MLGPTKNATRDRSAQYAFIIAAHQRGNVMPPLTEKQKRFIDEYLNNPNAAEAARKAGYSARTARDIGAENLAKPHIADEIARLSAIRAAEANITAKDIWQHWSAICKTEIGDVLDMTGDVPRLKPANQIPMSARRAIKSVKVKRYMEGHGEEARQVEVTEFAFWEKPNTLSTVAKAMGELIDRIIHVGPDGGPIRHDHRIQLPDLDNPEFLAKPAAERLRILREAVHSINPN